MLKKLDFVLSIVMGLSIGAFLAFSVYKLWDYKTHPELYLPYPAPWYLDVLLFGILTSIFLAVTAAVKRIMRKKMEQF